MIFQKKEFTSHSGLLLQWKINCDKLDKDDYETLAFLVSKKITFRKVIGIPEGGLKFAKALEKYITESSFFTLIVDDVLTTGKSMEEAKNNIDGPSIGVVIFARNICPEWICPIFEFKF